MRDAQTITMRSPCHLCGGDQGAITTKNGQDVVRCATCDEYMYCAPRTETGRAVRSLSSRPGIKPSARARILAEHDHACITCGRRAPDVALDLGHLISREDAERCGFLDDPIIDSEWNLAPQCQECNSGQRPHGSAGIRLIYRALVMKAWPKEQL